MIFIKQLQCSWHFKGHYGVKMYNRVHSLCPLRACHLVLTTETNQWLIRNGYQMKDIQGVEFWRKNDAIMNFLWNKFCSSNIQNWFFYFIFKIYIFPKHYSMDVGVTPIDSQPDQIQCQCLAMWCCLKLPLLMALRVMPGRTWVPPGPPLVVQEWGGVFWESSLNKHV